jgi:hypothetical protein
MGDDPSGFVPPPYDLRELGEGPAIYERLEKLADRMLAVAGEEVGCAFTRVPPFTERARGERVLGSAIPCRMAPIQGETVPPVATWGAGARRRSCRGGGRPPSSSHDRAGRRERPR